MRWRIALLVACVAASASARTVTRIRDNGPDSNRVVLVLIAEGYTSSQEAAFNADAQATLTSFFNASPWRDYAGHVNVLSDFVASAQSGADKPSPCWTGFEIRNVNTAFGATFCTGGVQRLLTVDDAAVLAEASRVSAQWDVVAVLVNSTEYGGSGGAVVAFSNDPQARGEVFIHEVGHVFAELADEYTTAYPAFPPGDSEPNVTFQTERELVKWQAWIAADTPLPTPASFTHEIGLFEGARYKTTGIYRPRLDCRMRTLGSGFDSVCKEAHVQALYDIVSPIDDASPAPGEVLFDACSNLLFSVAGPVPVDSTLAFDWTLDGVRQVAVNGSEFSLSGLTLEGDYVELSVTLTDTTPLVRRQFLAPQSESRAWTLRRRELEPDDPCAPPPCLPGDVSPAGRGDGRVSLADFVSARRKVLGLEPTVARDFSCSDLSPGALACDEGAGISRWCPQGDGAFTLLDSVEVRRLVGGLDVLGCEPCAPALRTHVAGRVPGDAAPLGAPDGRVDVADVVLALRASVGLSPVLAASDVAPQVLEADGPSALGDGVVDVADVVLLLRATCGVATLRWPVHEASLSLLMAAIGTGVEAVQVRVAGWPADATIEDLWTSECAGGSGWDLAGDVLVATCMEPSVDAVSGACRAGSFRYRSRQAVPASALHLTAQAVDSALVELSTLVRIDTGEPNEIR